MWGDTQTDLSRGIYDRHLTSPIYGKIPSPWSPVTSLCLTPKNDCLLFFYLTLQQSFLKILSFWLAWLQHLWMFLLCLGFLFPIFFLKLSLRISFNSFYSLWPSSLLCYTLFWVDLIHLQCLDYHLIINDDAHIKNLSPLSFSLTLDAFI